MVCLHDRFLLVVGGQSGIGGAPMSNMYLADTHSLPASQTVLDPVVRAILYAVLQG